MEIPRCSSLRYFLLTVQPFGLSSTPYIFIECLKPQEKYRNVNGVNIALLLDDGWLIDIDRNSRAVLAANEGTQIVCTVSTYPALLVI